MNTYDFIFWYTGYFAWLIVAILLLVIVALAYFKTWRVARNYEKLWRFFNAPREVRYDLNRRAAVGLSKEEVELLNRACDKVNRNLLIAADMRSRQAQLSEMFEEFDIDDIVTYKSTGEKYEIVSRTPHRFVFEIRALEENALLVANVFPYDIVMVKKDGLSEALEEEE